MIKRIIFAAVCMLMGATAAWAEGEEINALRLSLNEGTDTEVLFTHSPEITYRDANTMVLNYGSGTEEFNINGIKEMVFIHKEDTPTAITDILNEQFPAANKAVEGIFDLNGVKHDRITEPGIYIVNGKKVLVK